MYQNGKKKIKWFLLIAGLTLVVFSIPELFGRNTGNSKSLGSVRDGQLENGYLLPYHGANFCYFSPMSYYLLDNAYTHSNVYHTILEAYRTCEETCPDIRFRLMELSHKTGGQMLIHRTHQNGLSADFMVPKKRGKSQSRFYDKLGLWHYLLEFTETGALTFDRSVTIDFETMGKHILALDQAAQENGLRIKKVLLRIELKDDFYQTESGQQVKQKGIYFAQSMSGWTNRVHDDHYHVDFEFRN
ncbi:MAG: penicillin-insensitive murein endopeptidase [Saprospirales bacterium]|nr:penicillin-insensitive murein endopeptidase [Saprospirales bacterium]